MTYNMMQNKQAGKAYNKLMNDWYRKNQEGEEYDAFDPDWGRVHEMKEKEIVELVAGRFGITVDEVWYAAQELENGEEQRRWVAQTPWEPWTDDKGVRHHGCVCAEYWDRGLNCMCIPPEEIQRIAKALRRGDDIETIIDAGWGPN